MQIKKNTFILFFLVSLLFKPLWLFNNSNMGIPADDYYHWLHSATIAYDLDLNYMEDFSLHDATVHPVTNVPSSPPGAGYLSSPFVYFFSFFDKISNQNLNAIRINPLKSFSVVGYFSAGLIFTLISFNLLDKISKKNSIKTLLLFLTFLSSLNHYVTTRFLMSHAVEFFLATTILFIFENVKNKKINNKLIFSLTLSYFFLAITRPSTFLYYLILPFAYYKFFKIPNSNKVFLILNTSFLIYLYIFISQKLYLSNFILLNTYQDDMNAYYDTFTFTQILNGLLKLPNLFLSPSMGILWSTPIVFFGVLCFLNQLLNKNIDFSWKFFYSLFFIFSFTPLLVWQGREVAYGQRLLIGILPVCFLISSNTLNSNMLTKKSIQFFSFITYTGYLFFYSSEMLTLRKGVTLWGTNVGYVAQDYYFELIKGFLDFQTILSAFLRNIYIVNFFKFFEIEKFISKFKILQFFDSKKIETFINLSYEYSQLKLNYLIAVNLLIFSFSYLFAKLISK